MLRSKSPGLAIILPRLAALTALYYAISVIYVDWFYSKNPPHWDSIGSLTHMYELINRYHRDGAMAALSQAANGCFWLQNYFAVLAAPVLPKTPAAMMLINFICLFVAQAALFDMARRFDASRGHAFALSLLPYLADDLISVFFGFQDLRRDASFNALLLATFCLSMSYLSKSTVWRGIALGLAAGLTQWSRENALPYMAVVLAPAGIIALAQLRRTNQRGKTLGLMALPLIVFLMLAEPYWMNCASGAIEKYTFGEYAFGYSRLTSLAFYAQSPITIVLGLPSRMFFAKLGLLLIGLPALVVWNVRRGDWEWTPRRMISDHRAWLVWSAPVIYAGIIGGLSLVFGTAAFAGTVVAWPVLIAVFSLVVAISFTIRPRPGQALIRRLSYLAAIVLLLLGFAVDKLRLETYPSQLETVQQVKQLAPLVQNLAANNRIAWLWDGNLNYWVVNYYLAQAGESTIRFYYGGASLETAPDPRLGETFESRLVQIKESLLKPDVLILSDTPGAYAGILGPTFFNTYGYLVVPDLLASPQFEQVYEYESDGYHFVILKRRE